MGRGLGSREGGRAVQAEEAVKAKALPGGVLTTLKV